MRWKECCCSWSASVAVWERSCPVWELSCPTFEERAALLGKTASTFGLGANFRGGMALGFALVPHEVEDAGGGADELLLLAFGLPCCIRRVSTRSQADPMSPPEFNSIAVVG